MDLSISSNQGVTAPSVQPKTAPVAQGSTQSASAQTSAPIDTVTVSASATDASNSAASASTAAPADAAVQYTLPASVIANMQAFATTEPTQYTDQINTSAAILADGSTASDDDKLKAWIGLMQLTTSGAIYQAGNIADLQKAYTAANGTYEKHVADVELQYNQIENRLAAPGEAAGQSVNGYQNQLSALNSFSDSDQKILLATMSAAGYHGFSSVEGWQAFDTVDDWKTTLQQEAASFDTNNEPQPQPASATSTQRTAPAPTVASQPATANSMLAKLLKTPQGSPGSKSSSDIALQVITQAAHRMFGRAEPNRGDAAGIATDSPGTNGVTAPFKSGVYDRTASQSSIFQAIA